MTFCFSQSPTITASQLFIYKYASKKKHMYFITPLEEVKEKKVWMKTMLL
jgi:hypothetical protein